MAGWSTDGLATLGMAANAPLVAPLCGHPVGLAPALVQVGGFDPLRDENLADAAALRRAGGQAQAKVYPGQPHGFVQFFKDTEHNAGGETAMREGIAFIRRRLAARHVRAA